MKKKHETARGLFTLYKAEGKLYFELPLRLLGKEMLIGSTVTGISDNGNAIVGSKPQSPLHVKFTKNQTHVQDRKSTRLNSSHANISYAVFCLKKKTKEPTTLHM